MTDLGNNGQNCSYRLGRNCFIRKSGNPRDFKSIWNHLPVSLIKIAIRSVYGKNVKYSFIFDNVLTHRSQNILCSEDSKFSCIVFAQKYINYSLYGPVLSFETK